MTPDTTVDPTDPWSQRGYDVAFEWGATGAAQVTTPGDLLVVVDVLSFTTSVSVAVERGMAVHPSPPHGERAAALADRVGAALAVGRRQVSPTSPWSLSPAALRDAPFTPRLVLPSPNGSPIAAVQREATVIAACLRNASAAGRWAAKARASGRRVCVIAGGERWPDGSLRPALEDALGAGAVLSAIARTDAGARLSPEARAFASVFDATTDIVDAIGGCGSALELVSAGFGSDVEIACEIDVSDVVPVLADGAFGPAA